MSDRSGTIRVGLVGARGYTGAELVRLIDGHPGLELSYACSRAHAGDPVIDHIDHAPADLRFLEAEASTVGAQQADVCVLALPNDASARYVAAIDEACPDTVIVDLSADHRFDEDWAYGLCEQNADAIGASRRIANPGCYATAMQFATLPVLDLLGDVPPVFAGISGVSGAGSTPSPKNDPEVLHDNVLPYAPVGHVHEREVSHQLGRAVRFMPHVAPFFRGLSVSAALTLREPAMLSDIVERYTTWCADHPLVRTLETHTPTPRDGADTNGALIGGLAIGDDGRALGVTCAIDNLLKGAASQAIQNINLALGLDPLEGLMP